MAAQEREELAAERGASGSDRHALQQWLIRIAARTVTADVDHDRPPGVVAAVDERRTGAALLDHCTLLELRYTGKEALIVTLRNASSELILARRASEGCSATLGDSLACASG